MARMGRYVVLKDTNTALRRGWPFPLAREEQPEGLGSIPPRPSVECYEMAPHEAQRLALEAEVLGVARAMPTRLIEPREPGDDGKDLYVGAAAWGVAAVGAVTSPFDGAGVKVAVLDTGIDADHPAFSGVAMAQRDFTAEEAAATAHDRNGHGTHCAGTIFGRDVEDRRIGVAPGVTEALIGKVLADDGSGSSEMLFEALRWASAENARVISMSLGFDFPGFSQRLVEEYDLPVFLATSMALEGYRMNLRMFDRIMDLFRAQAAFGGGCVVVAASGNESERQIDPDYEVSASVPAAAEGVISVGALGRGPDGALVVAPFSNTAPVLTAPGVDVVSAAAGGGLRALSGTSMACPHAAGVAAHWWQMSREIEAPLTSRSVEARMLAAARRDVFAPGTDVADRGQGLATAPAMPVA